jgi:hypothetical protein
MNKNEILLTLAKSIIEIDEVLSKGDLNISDEHRTLMQDPHYSAFYLGARSVGSDHRRAHKGAKSYSHKVQQRQRLGHINEETFDSKAARSTGADYSRRHGSGEEIPIAQLFGYPGGVLPER